MLKRMILFFTVATLMVQTSVAPVSAQEWDDPNQFEEDVDSSGWPKDLILFTCVTKNGQVLHRQNLAMALFWIAQGGSCYPSWGYGEDEPEEPEGRCDWEWDIYYC